MISNQEIHEIREAIGEIENDVVTALGDDAVCCLCLCLDGYTAVVEFFGVTIWHSQEDDRIWDNEGYEPFEPFLRKKISAEVEKMLAINLAITKILQ